MSRPKRELVPILFAMYEKMGADRSLEKLSKVSGIKLEILIAYADAADWELRIVTEFTHGGATDEDKALSQQMSDLEARLFGKISDAIQIMDKCSVGLPFTIDSAKEFNLVAKAYETMVKASILAKTAFVPLSTELPTTWLDLVREVYKDTP